MTLSDENKKAILELARAYFAAAMKSNGAEISKEEYRAKWKENRKTYVVIARQAMNRLGRKGFSLVRTG